MDDRRAWSWEGEDLNFVCDLASDTIDVRASRMRVRQNQVPTWIQFATTIGGFAL